MARQRKRENIGLPPNLYVRNGYYSYRDPSTRKEYGLGRNKTLALTEAIQANMSIVRGGETLERRILAERVPTVSMWCEKYIEIAARRGLRASTIASKRSLHKAISKSIGDKLLSDISVRHVAELIDSFASTGKSATARQLRTELKDIFLEAIAQGLISENPVSITRSPKFNVARDRLTEQGFFAILKVAEKSSPNWFCRMLKAALITGQRQGDLCSMHFDNIRCDTLYIEQQKTSARIALPINASLGELKLSDCIPESGSGYIFSNDTEKKLTERAARFHFKKCRDLAEYDFGLTPPSFHEIRSLSARMHTKERGSDFAKKLLGHKSAEMTARYNDSRNGWNEVEF